MSNSDIKKDLEQNPSIDPKEIDQILAKLEKCKGPVRPNTYLGIHYYLLDGYHMWLSGKGDPCGTTCYYKIDSLNGDQVVKLEDRCPKSGLNIYRIELVV